MNKWVLNGINKLVSIVAVIFSAISIISISTIAVLNSIWIYSILVDKYGLVSRTDVSKEALVSDYSGLINYLQNPFIKKLHFDNFIMSRNGEIHFYEVKRIFIALIIIAIIFLIGVIVWILMSKVKNNIDKKGLIKILNNGSNLLLVFFVAIVGLYFIDFSWAFTMFHKIFFRNDYWIFDPALDPVINALPEALFMVMGAIILGIIIITVAIIKWIYYNNSRNTRLKINESINHSV